MTSEVLIDNLDWFSDNGFKIDSDSRKISLTIPTANAFSNSTVRAIDIYNNLIRFYKISDIDVKIVFDFKIEQNELKRETNFKFLNFKKKINYLKDNNIKYTSHGMHSEAFKKMF